MKQIRYALEALLLGWLFWFLKSCRWTGHRRLAALWAA